MQRLAAIKKEVLSPEDRFLAEAEKEDIAVCRRSGNGVEKAGVFSLKGLAGLVSIDAPEGTYENLIDGSAVTVQDGTLFCGGSPVIITWPAKGGAGTV